jgi:hypothetical protein
MRLRRPRWRKMTWVAATCIAMLGIWASPADASTGQFSRAEATPDWTHGSFAGSATWTSCNAGCKGWFAVVMVEPSTYTCEAEDWAGPYDPNVQMLWNSGGQSANGTVSFDQSGVSILTGVYGQRLCLIGVQTTTVPEIGTFVESQLLANAIMRVETPSVPSAPSTECIVATKEVKRLRKKLRTAEKRGAKQKVLRRDRKALARAKRHRSAVC